MLIFGDIKLVIWAAEYFAYADYLIFLQKISHIIIHHTEHFNVCDNWGLAKQTIDPCRNTDTLCLLQTFKIVLI